MLTYLCLLDNLFHRIWRFPILASKLLLWLPWLPDIGTCWPSFFLFCHNILVYIPKTYTLNPCFADRRYAEQKYGIFRFLLMLSNFGCHGYQMKKHFDLLWRDTYVFNPNTYTLNPTFAVRRYLGQKYGIFRFSLIISNFSCHGYRIWKHFYLFYFFIYDATHQCIFLILTHWILALLLGDN